MVLSLLALLSLDVLHPCLAKTSTAWPAETERLEANDHPVIDNFICHATKYAVNVDKDKLKQHCKEDAWRVSWMGAAPNGAWYIAGNPQPYTSYGEAFLETPQGKDVYERLSIIEPQTHDTAPRKPSQSNIAPAIN